MMSGKNYVHGERLIQILNLPTSAVVNGGAFLKAETARIRKGIRVQFSGYDEVIDPETYISESDGSILSPVNTQHSFVHDESPTFSPLESPVMSSPLSEQKKRREIAAPENFEFIPPNQQRRVDTMYEHSPLNPSPLKQQGFFESVEKDLPTPQDVEGEDDVSPWVVPLPPPLSVKSLPPHPGKEKSIQPQLKQDHPDESEAPPVVAKSAKKEEGGEKEKKKKVKRRHIQIQARPVEYRSVCIQVGIPETMEESMHNSQKQEWIEDRMRMGDEIAYLRAALRDTQEKLETISNQAYQRMIQMMQEKHEMEAEIQRLTEHIDN